MQEGFIRYYLIVESVSLVLNNSIWHLHSLSIDESHGYV